MWMPVSVDPVNATTIVKELSHLLEEKRMFESSISFTIHVENRRIGHHHELFARGRPVQSAVKESRVLSVW